MEMNKILMCLDYNDTIDNLIPKCAEYESGASKFPSFFRGVLSMAVATRSTVSVAIITAAHAEEIKEEINIINYYANMYCKLAIGDSGSLINYIVGDKSKTIYNCNTCTSQETGMGVQSKKEGVEAVLSLPSEQGTQLLITGGDSKEDISMMKVQTGGIPNVFVAPKENKEVLGDEIPSIRDSKNKNSDGIGRCLINISHNLSAFNLQDAFTTQTPQQEEPSSYTEQPFNETKIEPISKPKIEEPEQEPCSPEPTVTSELVEIANESSVDSNNEFIKISDQKVTVPTSHIEPATEQPQIDVLMDRMLEFPL